MQRDVDVGVDEVGACLGLGLGLGSGSGLRVRARVRVRLRVRARVRAGLRVRARVRVRGAVAMRVSRHEDGAEQRELRLVHQPWSRLGSGLKLGSGIGP